MIDNRFVKNKYVFNIISQRLKENIERLNQGTDQPYMTVPGFPFEVSEKDLHRVKIYTLISKSVFSRYDMITYITFPEYAELDEILDILSNENSEKKFEISESKLISCSNKVFSSIYMHNGSIISRLPHSFEFQPKDRIFNITPLKNQFDHAYCCIKQIRQEKEKYVYFDITNIMVFPELKIYAIKTSVFQEIPLEEKEGCFEKIKSYFNFFFNRHPKFD